MTPPTPPDAPGPAEEAAAPAGADSPGDALPSVGQVTEVLEADFPPATAAEWDQVGLAIGDAGTSVRRVLAAVDLTEAVAAEAIRRRADLIVTHHPLLLRGIHAVTSATAKGWIVAALIRSGVSVWTGHTNVDHGVGGTNDAMADALSLTERRPLEPVEGTAGLGRIGTLPEETTLSALAARIAGFVPATARGVAYAGDPGKSVRTVALCSGAGDSLLDLAGHAAVDCYVTSDLRHHPALEFREQFAATALIDVSHFASEWLWLPRAKARILEAFPQLEVFVSTLNTDPWTGVRNR